MYRFSQQPGSFAKPNQIDCLNQNWKLGKQSSIKQNKKKKLQYTNQINRKGKQTKNMQSKDARANLRGHDDETRLDRTSPLQDASH